MDRNTVTRWLLIAGALLAAYWFFQRRSGEAPQQIPTETYVDAPGFAPDVLDVVPGQPAPPRPPEGETCTVAGIRFEADLSTRGAGLTHLRLTDARYADSQSRDMSTTPDIERWRNLRTLFRKPGTPAAPEDQVRYDRFEWQLERLGSRGCRFTYEDPGLVRVVKTISAGDRPFELNVETTLTNLSSAPKTHTTSVEAFAYRTNKEVKGRLGRVSPFQTGLECARGDHVERLTKGSDKFKTDWFSLPLADRYAAIANYYFAQALVPLDVSADAGGSKPSCDLLDEQWYGGNQKPDDDEAGDVYKVRLSYPSRQLGEHESATYRQIAFFGPKERDVLANAAGGTPRLQDLINLGTFSVVARYLVTIITWIHAHITMHSWGLAIIVLTIALKIALFPLTWKQMQSTLAMRRIKPEIDDLTAKFKDDVQAKQLAMMELYRKHKINPLGGCLPALVQLPIWFAFYATLQTAVEFYHTPFMWFPDLSAPDQLFFHTVGPLPFILGGTTIVQQRIIPQQGMDPVQQKMMTWLMPLIFTGMMLFLPAALGVYMLTNSILGITQQLAIEKLAPRSGASPGGPAARAGSPGSIGQAPARRGETAGKTDKTGKGTPAPALGKGKARV
jgi:YidC/Oxa1 family membrane protein insertase